MLGKFKADWGFLGPLAAHVAVHGVMTAAIAMAMAGPQVAVVCGLFDMAVHFTMDRLKAGPRYLGRYKSLCQHNVATAGPAEHTANKLFWWSLGLDQMVHHLTHYAIIAYILTRS